MASWMYRGRSLRSNRSVRSRKDSEDEFVQLDSAKEASEVALEVLCNIFRRQGVSEGRKLGYLNAFVTFITKTEVFPNFGYNVDELLCCLRVTLVHDATQVRAAGLRTIRYLLRDEQDVLALIRLNIPALIARSLDLALKNDMERIQAMRVCRRILLHSSHLFPSDVARSLVSLANGGVEEKDRMLRVCLALLSELCVLNPEVFVSSGGVAAISRNLLESHPPRVTEALAGTLLFLLTRPHTRALAKVDLSVLAAPYCDFHYRHTGWGSDRDKDDRETRLSSSKLALLSVLRSFPGLLHFCQPHCDSGLKSLVAVLSLRQLEARKAVLDLLYDLLGLPLPAWTDEASVALEAVDPARPQDQWKLAEGFVAAEAKCILPNLSRVRPNLVEVHTALLLYCLVKAGLLEALVEVIVTSDTFICLRAAILLGEMLHLVHTLLPAGCSMPSLPSLLAHASGSGTPASRQRALFALATLSRLHAMFKQRPAPCSLFLDQVLQFAGTWPQESIAGHRLTKAQVYQLVGKDSEDNIKDSVVLSNKDPFFWNWNVIRAILKSRSDTFKRLEDSNQRTFIRRLVEYYKPSSNRFSRLKIGQKHSHPYTLVACELLDFLVDADEGQGEASKALSELLADICDQISAIQSSKSAHDCLFSPHHVTHSMCQDYFLFIGRLAHHSKGVHALEQAGIFQRLLELVVSTNHDCYVKLIVSSLDYTIEGMSRVILGKVLKSPVESSRLYATRFLLVLVRARVSDFAKWGVELLVMQLYDTSAAVSLTASEILDEACDHKPYLEAVIALRPSLLHLGDRGLLLLVRFLSLPSGFSYLHDANFVNNEILRWNNVFNVKYVHIVEAALHDALTLHQKSEAGSYTGRLSNAKHVVRDVFLPPHLLGQLAQHARGLELLTRELATLQRHCQVVRAGQCSTEEDSVHLKTSIWCVGHVCSSPGGLLLMINDADAPGNCALTLVDCLVSLAEQSPHYGVRATAFYACALVATTQPGAVELDKSGWVCIRHARNERFPVTEEPEGFPSLPIDGELARVSDEVTLELRESRRKRSTSQCSSQSAASWAAHFYIDTDEENDEENMRETSSPRRESGLGSISPVTVKLAGHRRSQTLPHTKPPRPPKHHQRSLSESKGDVKLLLEPGSPRRNSLVESDSKACVEVGRVRKKGTVASPLHLDIARANDKFLHVPETQVSGTSPVEKSRSNSCTDSGVSSCDDYASKPVISDKVQTLSPIPSSASLSTLRSFGQQVRGHSARTRALSTQEDRVVEVEVDRAVLGASWQDIQGFAALRAMHRFRPKLFSESSATADILVEQLASRHGKHTSQPSVAEWDAPLRRVASSLSSVCSRPPLHPSPQHAGSCYRGIALPRDLASMFPADVSKQLSSRAARRKRGAESFSELEEVQEAGNEVEDRDVSSLSDSDASPDANSEHDALRCLVCAARPPAPPATLVRGRRVSTGSHRTRTDTESSGERLGAGDSPVLGKRATALLAATATPNSASSMSSLDLGMSQRTEEEAAALGKHAVKKEILKHVERLSNPVWSKSSRQVLLQLKQKFSASFHDVCLYSDVCALLASCTYRLASRRVVQELFYDCPFDEMFDEPAAILKLQESTSAQPSPFSSPSITIAEPLELMEQKSRALDVVAEEHSAASGSGELGDVPLAQHSPSVLQHQFYPSSDGKVQAHSNSSLGKPQIVKSQVNPAEKSAFSTVPEKTTVVQPVTSSYSNTAANKPEAPSTVTKFTPNPAEKSSFSTVSEKNRVVQPVTSSYSNTAANKPEAPSTVTKFTPNPAEKSSFSTVSEKNRVVQPVTSTYSNTAANKSQVPSTVTKSATSAAEKSSFSTVSEKNTVVQPVTSTYSNTAANKPQVTSTVTKSATSAAEKSSFSTVPEKNTVLQPVTSTYSNTAANKPQVTSTVTKSDTNPAEKSSFSTVSETNTVVQPVTSSYSNTAANRSHVPSTVTKSNTNPAEKAVKSMFTEKNTVVQPTIVPLICTTGNKSQPVISSVENVPVVEISSDCVKLGSNATPPQRVSQSAVEQASASPCTALAPSPTPHTSVPSKCEPLSSKPSTSYQTSVFKSSHASSSCDVTSSQVRATSVETASGSNVSKSTDTSSKSSGLSGEQNTAKSTTSIASDVKKHKNIAKSSPLTDKPKLNSGKKCSADKSEVIKSTAKFEQAGTFTSEKSVSPVLNKLEARKSTNTAMMDQSETSTPKKSTPSAKLGANTSKKSTDPVVLDKSDVHMSKKPSDTATIEKSETHTSRKSKSPQIVLEKSEAKLRKKSKSPVVLGNSNVKKSTLTAKFDESEMCKKSVKPIVLDNSEANVSRKSTELDKLSPSLVVLDKAMADRPKISSVVSCSSQRPVFEAADSSSVISDKSVGPIK